MQFTEQLWQQVQPIRAAIARHPFLHELSDGTLPPETFRHYIVQDSLYLAEYARVLAVAAAKAPTAAGRLEFSGGARTAVLVEEALHQSFFGTFGIDAAAAVRAEASPVCLGYTSYLASLAATRSYEELIAAVLPCFWVYWEVGCDLKPRARRPNPYEAWIDTYGAADFGEATQRVRGLVDAGAAGASEGLRAAMADAFIKATRFEWMFWDSAYHRMGWPAETALAGEQALASG